MHLYACICVRASVRMWLQVPTGSRRGAQDPLELQMVMSHPMWKLGTERGPPGEQFVLLTAEQSLQPSPRIFPFGLWFYSSNLGGFLFHVSFVLTWF